STAPDTDNSSLGGTAYNQFSPENDYARDSFISRHRLVAYGVLDIPFGRTRRYGTGMPRWTDAVWGNWHDSWNMFAKSGTGFTAYWTCNSCWPFYPGNIASGFLNALGDFSDTTFRPIVVGKPYSSGGGSIFDPNAFVPPPVGATLLDDPRIARRNFL